MVTSSEQPSTVNSSEEAVVEPVVDETPVNEEPVEPVEPVIEAGVNGQELFVTEDTKSLEVFHNKKKWVFTYKELSWAEKYKCVDIAQVWDAGEFSFSLSKYYVAAITTMIQDSPIRPFTETTISKLDTGVVSQLLAIVPPPADPDASDAAKKALGQEETG